LDWALLSRRNGAHADRDLFVPLILSVLGFAVGLGALCGIVLLHVL